MTQKLALFQPGKTDQSSFFDSMEELLAALNEHNVEPSKVHTLTHNTRCWMAVIIVEEPA